jgi:hypothetical protein
MNHIREAIVTARCLQTWRASGPCQRCGEPADSPAHLPGVGLLCELCCCGNGHFSQLPAEAFERAGQPAEQGSLF